MKIRYVPDRAKDLNDILVLDGPLYNLMGRIRAHFKTTKYIVAPSGLWCANCKEKTVVDIHHIRPVWTYALDEILRHKLSTQDDVNQLCRMAFYETFDPSICNHEGNLIGLCGKCHPKADKRAIRLWKDYFEEHYPVVFGLRSMSRVKKLLAR